MNLDGDLPDQNTPCLMGARLFNPASGRFLQVDPVTGGNVNAYAYPVNPFDMNDTTGEPWWVEVISGVVSSFLGAMLSGACSGLVLALPICAALMGGITGIAAYMAYQVVDRRPITFGECFGSSLCWCGGRPYIWKDSSLRPGEILESLCWDSPPIRCKDFEQGPEVHR
jgi:RHS repeat-associated protein